MAKPTAPDPAIGTWKLNLVESSFRLLPAPMRIMRVEAFGNGLKVSADGVDAQGNAVHIETAYKFNGRDYPFKGSFLVDTISAKRINNRTSESVLKKRGKVVLTVRAVISVDGKTLRLARTGEGVQGRAGDDVVVYDKQ